MQPQATPEGRLRLRGYAFALAAVAAILLIHWLIEPLTGNRHAPFLPLFAVAAAAWYGGFWAGLLALAAGYAGLVYWFISPHHSLAIADHEDFATILLSMAMGLVCATLGEVQLVARRRAFRMLRSERLKHALLETEIALRSQVEEDLRLRSFQLDTSHAQMTETIALLDTFVMNAPIGLCFCDNDLRFVLLNQYLAEGNGISPRGHLGKTLTEVLPDFPEEVAGEIRSVLETGRPLIQRTVISGPEDAPDRRKVWQASYYPVYGADGAILGAGGVALDITERLRGERALQASEQRFRTLVDSLPQLIWTCSPEGRCDFLSRQWAEYTGVPEADLLGYAWLKRVHPDDLAMLDAEWRAAVARGDRFDTAFRIRRRDGEYRWFAARALPLRGEPGEPERWLGTNTDIHAQRQQAEVLEQMVRERTDELQRTVESLRQEVEERKRAVESERKAVFELRQSNEDLEKFAYVASHDLQEPLRKIQAFGDRLRTKCRDQLDEQGGDYLDRILSSAERMRTLINDLLTFSRVTTKGRSFSPVDLGVVASEVLSDLEARVQQTGGAVDLGPLPTIDADPLQMRQLFLNLLSNALKFHKPGAAPAVAVRAEPEEPPAPGVPARRFVRITVADDGIGFDEKYLDRIFQLFQRLHGRSSYEGTGLGLAICRKIIERHGGTITASSSPGEGATFLVRLPSRQPLRDGNTES